MKRLIKKRKTDNRGLTLVELVCAMAILSIIGTIVGGILVVSAQSYDTGINEAELQQEAQMVVNQINDLVIDTTATESVSFAGDTLTIPEGIKTHKVRYDAAQQKLLYSCDASGEELMASGITSFNVDTASFQNTGNLYVDIGLERMSNGQPRTFNATFQITSRNGVVDTTPTASIDVVDDVVLEPHQSYTFVPTVVGITDQNVTWSIVGGNTDSGTTMIGNKITIAGGERGSIIHLLVSTAAKDGDGNPMATRAVRVRIRRVNGITANLVERNGEAYKDGTEYIISADLMGTYLDQEPWSWDNDYVSPYTVTWSAITTGSVTAPDIQLLTGDPSNPSKFYAKVTLKGDMPRNTKITIRATASHPAGSNKTSLAYGNVYGDYIISNTRIIEPMHSMGRGSDDPWGKVYVEDLKALLREKYGKDSFQFTVNYRFRETGTGDAGWSRWYSNTEIGADGGGSSVINGRPGFGFLMYYNKSYDVQCELKIIDPATGKVMWPFADTPSTDYILNGTIEKVSISFKSTALGFTSETGWSEGHVSKVNKNFSGDILEFVKHNSLGGTQYEKFKNDVSFVLQRKEAGVWKDVETIKDKPNCWINLNGVAGEYRIRVSMKEYHTSEDNLTGWSYYGMHDIWRNGNGSGEFYFIAE